MSREAKAQRQVPEQGRCSIIALPTVIVLGMTSAAVLGAAGQNESSLIIDAAANHEIRVRKSVTALTRGAEDYIEAVLVLKREKSPSDNALSAQGAV